MLDQNTGLNQGTQILQTLLRAVDSFQEAGQQLIKRVEFNILPAVDLNKGA
jgi:hypothetical protein